MRIEALETIIPEERLETSKIIREAGGDDDEIRMFKVLFGMHRVAIADPQVGVCGYLNFLLDRMHMPAWTASRQVLLHAHSLPLSEASRLELADLKSHPVFGGLMSIGDIDQFNCAGMFHALQMARRLLETAYCDEIFVFAGDDLMSWPLATRYVPSCTVLGDGFALLRLSNAIGGVQIGPVFTRHFAGYEAGLDADSEEMDRYNRAHLQIVSDSLSQVGHILSDQFLFPHNINGLAWRLYCRQSGLDGAQIQDALVSDIGHCCNADPLLVLKQALDQGPVKGTLLSVGMAGFSGVAPVSGAFEALAA